MNGKDIALIKALGGGGSGGSVPTLHITVTSLDKSTMKTTITADKTLYEMRNVAGPTWCVITVPASVSPTGSELVFDCSPYKRGFAFGYGLVLNSEGGIVYAVEPGVDDGWTLNFKYLM